MSKGINTHEKCFLCRAEKCDVLQKIQKSISFALIQGKARPHEQTHIEELSPKLK